MLSHPPGRKTLSTRAARSRPHSKPPSCAACCCSAHGGGAECAGAAGGAANHSQSGGYACSSLSMTVKSSPGCLPGGMVTSILSPLGGRTKMVCDEEAVVSGIAKV